jgi:hypothetical protein
MGKEHVCAGVIPNTVIICSEGGNYCSAECEAVALRVRVKELEKGLGMIHTIAYGVSNQFGRAALDEITAFSHRLLHPHPKPPSRPAS